jgi:hypothetical protein
MVVWAQYSLIRPHEVFNPQRCCRSAVEDPDMAMYRNPNGQQVLMGMHVQDGLLQTLVADDGRTRSSACLPRPTPTSASRPWA